jgi:hypothetical protein
MILKGLKTKSVEKATKKSISERQLMSNSGVIESVGLIVSANDIKLTDIEIEALFSDIKLKHFKLIKYAKKLDKTEETALVTPKDFGWNGVFKTEELKTFSTINFDMLVILTESVDPYLKALFALTDAKFKISNLEKLEAISDLTIQTTTQNLTVLKTELIKYLTILNKI